MDKFNGMELDDASIDGVFGGIPENENVLMSLSTDKVPVIKAGDLQLTDLGMFLARDAFRIESPKLKPPLVQEANGDEVILPSECDSLIGYTLIGQTLFNREQIAIPAKFLARNEIISQTIRLNRHARYVRRTMKYSLLNKIDFETMIDVPDCTPKVQYTPLRNLSKARFILGDPVCFPDLRCDTINRMILKSLCTILSEVGISKCDKSTLFILSDVVKKHFIRLTRGLNYVYQPDIRYYESGIPDALDHSLNNVCAKGVNSARFFFNKLIVRRRNRAFIKCKRLHELYFKTIEVLKDKGLRLRPFEDTEVIEDHPMLGNVLQFEDEIPPPGREP